MAMQRYYFLTVQSLCLCQANNHSLVTKTRSLVQTEGIITQLILEHALRIRVKAEVPESEQIRQLPTTVADAESDAEDERSANSQEETVLASSTSVSSNAKGPEKPANASRKSENLVGKVCSICLLV